MSYMSDLGAMAPLAPMAAKVAPKLGMRTQPVMQLTTALKTPAQIKAETQARLQQAGMGGSTKILLLGGAAAAIWFLFLRKKPVGGGNIVGKTIAVRSLAREGI